MICKFHLFIFSLLALSVCASDLASWDPQMTANSAVVSNGLRWVDGRTLPLEGRAFDNTETYYERLPRNVSTNVNGGVRFMKRYTAGLQFRFVTDSTRMSVVWKSFEPNPKFRNMSQIGRCGIDVYRLDAISGRWRFVASGAPEGRRGVLTFAWTPGEACLINLPSYDGVDELRLGMDFGAKVMAAPPHRSGVTKPVVFYGTSITHGASASRPGMAFVNLIGRELDVPVVNLGFSGSGVMELEMSDHLAAIDASCYVLDCLWNMGGAGRRVEENYEPFVRNLRTKRPGVPIVMAGRCDVFCRDEGADERFVRALHGRLVAEGWTGLSYLPGKGMYADDREGTSDGIHPNDWGMLCIAKVYGDAVRKALGLMGAQR